MSNDRTVTDWMDIITAIYIEVYGTDVDYIEDLEDFIDEGADLKSILSNKKLHIIN
jgi:hypothetical protein